MCRQPVNNGAPSIASTPGYQYPPVNPIDGTPVRYSSQGPPPDMGYAQPPHPPTPHQQQQQQPPPPVGYGTDYSVPHGYAQCTLTSPQLLGHTWTNSSSGASLSPSGQLWTATAVLSPTTSTRLSPRSSYGWLIDAKIRHSHRLLRDIITLGGLRERPVQGGVEQEPYW